MISIRLLPFLALFLVAPTPLVGAADRLSGPISATITKIIDGDTLQVRAKIWLGQSIDISVRLRGIDTPEHTSTCSDERALAAKAQRRLHDLVTHQGAFIPVTLSAITHDKYGGRVVAYVKTRDGRSLSHILLREKIARPYSGKKAKQAWCLAQDNQAITRLDHF